MYYQLNQFMDRTNHQFWSEAHIDYKNYLYLHKRSTHNIIDTQELEWRKKWYNSPNGHLLTKNSFFDEVGGNDKLYLLHTTSKLDKILEAGKLYPSGGCLVGSPYCTPLTSKDSLLFTHNLADYIKSSGVDKCSQSTRQKFTICK